MASWRHFYLFRKSMIEKIFRSIKITITVLAHKNGDKCKIINYQNNKIFEIKVKKY